MRRYVIRAAGWFALGAATGFYAASRSIAATYGPYLAQLSEARERLETTGTPEMPGGDVPPPRAATREDLERLRGILRRARGIDGPTIRDLADRERFDRKGRGA